MEKMQPYFVPFAIVIAGALVAGAVIFSGGGGASVPQAGNEEPDLSAAVKNVRPVDASDHVRGNVNAPITIIEYSDYECPFCGSFHPTIERIMAEYAGQVRWVYRHLPLVQIHPQANPAALASECVAELAGNDAFWQMTDSLIDNQQALSSTLYEQIAAGLGVDASAFSACFAEARHQGRIDADIQNALESGARGTPFSVVMAEGKDTIAIPGAYPFDAVKAAVDAQLE